jgi:Uma2 family endonuclease
MGAPKLARYEDLLNLPPHHTGQIVAGTLHSHPRPALPHARATTAIGEELGPPFRRGKNGPGGWVILDEPELHLGADILVPDLAGWRRERVSVGALDGAFATLRPDWACEVLSPSTARLDRGDKLEVYRREGVGHVWLVDPAIHTVEELRLDGPTYRLAATFSGEGKVRAEPFDAIELDLSALWTE